MQHVIGFLGAGRMATALAGGLVRAGVAPAERLWASDPDPGSRDRFLQAVPGAHVVDQNAAVAERADVLVLAVKPAQAVPLLAELGKGLRPQTLVVSIAAGVTLAALAKGARGGTRLVRVMPNTPALVGKGASAFARGATATDQDAATVAELLSAVGWGVEVSEPLLDAVTGLSGSGPAFVYTAIEALADAGVRQGLPRPIAAELAARTVAGAAEMVLATGEHPAALREAVTSPGGTTAAGLAELDRLGLRHALAEGVAAATRRSKELGGA